MAHTNRNYEEETKLEISESEKKDLEREVKHLRETIQLKNREIGSLKFKLRCSNSQLSDLKLYLTTHISLLADKLLESDSTNILPICSTVNPDPEFQTVDPPLPVDSSGVDGGVEGNDCADINAKTDKAKSEDRISLKLTEKKLAVLNPCYIEEANVEEADFQQGNKWKIKCFKCSEKFLTAVQLDEHLYKSHKSSSSQGFSLPVQKKALRVGKLETAKDINMNNSKLATTSNGIPGEGLFNKGKCLECGKLMLKKSLTAHRKLWCKKVKSSKPISEPVEEDRVGLNDEEVDKISIKLKSSMQVNGDPLRSKLSLKPSNKVKKVIEKFSRKLLVCMDMLELRCDGRVWGHEEEVRGLQNKTVWLCLVEVKSEENSS